MIHRYFLIVIILILSEFSCAQLMEQKQYYDENKAEVNISNNDPSLNGPYITYYENGQLKVLGLYQNNEADSS
ncbi:MAG: hypothetical protein HQ474_10980 [Flammeovirgaceae bacterium]|nr:hypothetical protein [Flammeovirgaceae bacterium]